MPTSSSLLAFALVSAAIIVVPGPSVLFIVGRAIAAGRRVALLTVVGNAAGVVVQLVLVALGVGALLERSTTLFAVVRLAGAGYLVWLGWRAWRTAADGPFATSTGPGTSGPSPVVTVATPTGTALREGFVVGVANPKLAVFLVALLPQYVAGTAPAAAQMLVLGLAFTVIALVLDSGWALAAGAARDALATTPCRLVALRRAGGVVLMGLGLVLAVTERTG